MNRRTLITGLAATAATALLPPLVVAQSDNGAVAYASRAWMNKQQVGLTWVSTYIRSYMTPSGAEGRLHEALADPIDFFDDDTFDVERILTPDETPSFAATGYGVLGRGENEGHAILVQVENLLYHFWIEGLKPIDRENGHELVQSILDRAVTTRGIRGDDLVALLPTEDEVKPYGLTVLVGESQGLF